MTTQPSRLPDEPVRRLWPAINRRRAWIALATALTLAAAAGAIGRLPALLVTEESWAHADYALILDDSCFKEAARLYRDGRVDRVLLVGRYHEPIVRLRIIAPYEQAALKWLADAGIPARAVEIIPAATHNSWDIARELEPWLAKRPRVKLDVLADRLSSGRDRYVLRSVLGSRQAEQLRVFGVPNQAIVEHGWWHHRHTLKCLAGACLAFAFDYVHGPPSEQYQAWDPAAFAKTLQ